MSNLLELVKRCEAAMGPDRELDAAISCQYGISPSYEGDGVYGCPRFTSSLDAALTLAPGFRVDITRRDDGRGYACVWGSHGNRSNLAATPILALCAAALRARFEMEGES